MPVDTILEWIPLFALFVAIWGVNAATARGLKTEIRAIREDLRTLETSARTDIQAIRADMKAMETGIRADMKAGDAAIRADDPEAVNAIKALTGGYGCEVSIDCSGSPQGRLLALQGTRRWGRAAMVGEGNRVDFDVSQTIIHNQITIYGSWVTSLGHMEDLVEKLVEWNLKPEIIVSHRFALEQADEAYKVADAGLSGKVCIVME